MIRSGATTDADAGGFQIAADGLATADTFREALLDVGANDADIDAMAELQAQMVVEWATDRAKRDGLWGLIVKHLALTQMNFQIAHFVDGRSIVDAGRLSSATEGPVTPRPTPENRTKTGRDARGRFRKGVSGKPGGQLGETRMDGLSLKEVQRLGRPSNDGIDAAIELALKSIGGARPPISLA